MEKNLKEKINEFSQDEKMLNQLSGIFKILGDPTRLRIIYALSLGPQCVSDIAELLEMSQSSISHQLSLLKFTDLVQLKKDGRKNYYSLDDEHVLRLFEDGHQHVKHKIVNK